MYAVIKYHDGVTIKRKVESELDPILINLSRLNNGKIIEYQIVKPQNNSSSALSIKSDNKAFN